MKHTMKLHQTYYETNKNKSLVRLFLKLERYYIELRSLAKLYQKQKTLKASLARL